MTFGKWLTLVVAVCVIALTGAACGKEGDQTEQAKSGSEKGAKSTSAVQRIAKQAMATVSIDDEFLEGRRLVEAAGFAVKTYEEFPVQEVAKKGRVLVYTDKRKKQSGVVYLKKTGGEIDPVWHWYFEDMVPDSVVNKEINRDGLWDIRVVFSRGKAVELIQDDSFTLIAPGRSDWIAMNGACSSPLSPEFALWKCFDGDTTTAWKSSVSNGAFIELAVPFGVQDGVLSLGTLSLDQPDRCVVYGDGKRIGEIEIQPAAGRQMIALDAGVKGAKKVRLEFPSVRGSGGVVAVAEIGLR